MRRFVTVTILGLALLTACGEDESAKAARAADMASQEAEYNATRNANPKGDRPEPSLAEGEELNRRILAVDKNIWPKKIVEWSRYTCDDIWKGGLSETRLAMNAAQRFTTGDAEVDYAEGQAIVVAVKDVFCHE